MLCLVKCDEGRFSSSVFRECLQVGGSRKISEVQVRVRYYWQRLFSFTYVQVKFVLADAVF